MLPAIPAAKPLVKWGLVAGVVLLYSGMVFNAGREYVQDQWDTAIARQAAESVKQMAGETRVAVQSAVDTAKQEQTDRENLRKIERKVANNAQDKEKPCVLDRGYVDVRDTVVSVLNEAVQRVPAPNPAPGESDGLRAEGDSEVAPVPQGATFDAITDPLNVDATPLLTTDEAGQQDADIAEELMQCRTKYAGLKQYELGIYIVRKALQEGEEP